mmetsp:Transcript_62293/g.161601  ORF Transcript_62293/g.161601 Transcript_62293/m.161601 type:complete len:94 (-) Transcript_62293:422-703(-)
MCYRAAASSQSGSGLRSLWTSAKAAVRRELASGRKCGTQGHFNCDTPCLDLSGCFLAVAIMVSGFVWSVNGSSCHVQRIIVNPMLTYGSSQRS